MENFPFSSEKPQEKELENSFSVATLILFRCIYSYKKYGNAHNVIVSFLSITRTVLKEPSSAMMTKREVSTLSRLLPRGCCLLYNLFYTADVTISDHCGEVARDSP